jgi:hypothetical protein
MTRLAGHRRSNRQVLTLRKERKWEPADENGARVGREIGNSPQCPGDVAERVTRTIIANDQRKAGHGLIEGSVSWKSPRHESDELHPEIWTRLNGRMKSL